MDANYSETASTVPVNEFYSESVAYDLNGNITNLYRNSKGLNGAAEQIDRLEYTYAGNSLTFVKDASHNISGYPDGDNTISYDANGNMTNYVDKGYTGITYNFLNLSSKITNSNKALTTNYIYSTDGTKMQMTNGSAVTDYLGNFQYTSTVGVINSSVVSNEEGYFDFINNRYVYQYKDHQGNIRISYAKGSDGKPVILEENNYYAFGLKHAGYNTGDTTNNNFKYLYNGKELQANGNLDYGWRQYMPDLGRWNGIDQLSEKFHFASPYAYVANNPVSNIDPDGRDIIKTGERDWALNGNDAVAAMTFLQNGGNLNDLETFLGSWVQDGGSIGNNTIAFWDAFYNTIPIEEVVVKGRGKKSNWNVGFNYAYNRAVMESGISRAMAKYAFQQNWSTYYGMVGGNMADDIHTMLDVGGNFPVAGELLDGFNALLYLGQGDYLNASASATAMIPILGTGLKYGVKGIGKEIVEEGASNLWRIGAYNKMKGIEKGLDAHHVGQSALMKKFIAGYDHDLAPTILIPAVGHRFKGPNGIVSRSTKGFTNARQVLARDIFELRRVYGSEGIPNSALQELIQKNKDMYQDAFIKIK